MTQATRPSKLVPRTLVTALALAPAPAALAPAAGSALEAGSPAASPTPAP
jgi:hypothetical protein